MSAETIKSAEGQGASPEQELNLEIEAATEEVLQSLDALPAKIEQIDLSKATSEQQNKLAELWSTLKKWARLLTVSALPLLSATALAQAHQIEARVVKLGVAMPAENHPVEVKNIQAQLARPDMENRPAAVAVDVTREFTHPNMENSSAIAAPQVVEVPKQSYPAEVKTELRPVPNLGVEMPTQNPPTLAEVPNLGNDKVPPGSPSK